MSDLIVVAFPDEDTADRVLNKLQALQKEHLIDLEDACIVVRDPHGKLRMKQAVNLSATIIHTDVCTRPQFTHALSSYFSPTRTKCDNVIPGCSF
jgi:hypothetical protein